MLKYSLSLLLICYSFFAWATVETPQTEVEQAGQAWQHAIASEDAHKIADLYAPDAHLYATFENHVDTPPALLSYFQKLTLNKNLQVRFGEQYIRVYGNVAINSGLYTFSYIKNGKKISIPARYTFVYLYQHNHWLIIDHHSSVLPKP